MNILRRFASTSAAQTSSIASASTPAAPRIIPSSALPPFLERHILKHLSRSPDSRIIPNPFLTARDSAQSLDGTEGTHIRSRSISRRREKQLRGWYPDVYIPGFPPSSDFSTAPTRIEVEMGDEKIQVMWEGEGMEQRDQGYKDLYASRRIRFKGHKHEREKPERQRETQERVQGMEKRIDDWKKTKLETKATLKPSLPF